MNTNIIQTLNKIQSGHAPTAVMAVVVSTTDSTPQSPGARMLVLANGKTVGTVGGGAVEKLAIDHAGEIIVKNISTDIQTYDMDGIADENNPSLNEKSTGMLCGGCMTIYFERIAPEERFLVYGCGHIGSILAPLADQCGFHVTAIDHRTEMTQSDRFNSTIDIQCTLPADHADAVELLTGDTVVIMTHNHQFDAAVLGNLLKGVNDKTMPRYVGMIGSAKKVKAILDKLNQDGIPQSVLDRVHTPIGLNSGGGSPGEIAVSIMAEVLAVKYGKLVNNTVTTMKG